MKKRWILLISMVLMLALVPRPVISEGEDTVRLARVLYTLCRDQDDGTLMKMGSVVMNRVDSPWFPDRLMEVLCQAQQFPCGTRYDARTLEAAYALMDGARALSPEVLYYQALDASAPYADRALLEQSGDYGFFSAPNGCFP